MSFGNTKGWLIRWLPVIAWMGLLFYLSAQSTLPTIPVLDSINWNDKIKHFAFYGVLGALIWRALGSVGSKWWAMAAVIVIASIYGASDEWHQGFVPGRTRDVFDWTADTLGAAIVAIILAIWWPSHAGRRL